MPGIIDATWGLLEMLAQRISNGRYKAIFNRIQADGKSAIIYTSTYPVEHIEEL